MEFVDRQWQGIMANDRLFTQTAKVTTADGQSFELPGFFSSGTYGMKSETSYVREKAVARHSFTFMTSVLPCPTSALKGALFEIGGYSYSEAGSVLGGHSGLSTVTLAQKRKG